MRLLIVEDDRTIVEAIRKRLRQQFIIDAAFSGRTGTHLAEVCNYDLIIVDLHLPDGNGIDLCRLVRVNKVRTPILMLTAENSLSDKVAALDAGADDYLTKPFDYDELTARMRALMRRHYGDFDTSLIHIEDITIDPTRRLVVQGEKVVSLRRKEFDLLEYMVRNRGQVLKREMILNHVWEDEKDAYTNIVDVHIKYLRDRLDRSFGKRFIRTIHGVGYIFDA